jgi:Fe-S-cluster containining protein
MFTINVIEQLLKTSDQQLKKLEETYRDIPATRCKRKAHCCSMLPEMSLIEALLVIRQIMEMGPDIRINIFRKIVSYFFLNPVEIIKCPFLKNTDCLIYQKRFFGCRAYGLWSRDYYENLTEKSLKAKIHLRNVWNKLGISLPQEIVDFQLHYCSNVELVNDTVINDSILLNIFNNIETMSGHFSEWHRLFREMYFYDLSFLFASLIFGINEAVSLKFTIVGDIVKKGKRERLNEIIDKLPERIIYWEE